MSENRPAPTVVEINSVAGGSTGGIALGIAARGRAEGMRIITAFPDARSNRRNDLTDSIAIGSRISRNAHLLFGGLTGLNEHFSAAATCGFVRKLGKLRPDVVHLHNLHGSYINTGILFRYLEKSGVPVVWTLHDCWAFTGRCPYFDMRGCEKWKTGCGNCPMEPGEYPPARRDATALQWNHKRKTFLSAENITIVTPSRWLAGLVKRSFLGGLDVRTIYNGIDTETFRPSRGELYDRIKAPGKRVVLGVAFGWEKRKGLDVFIKLAETLPEDYTIVLAGVDEKTKEALPARVVSFERLGKNELAQLYTSADVFVNPTREDNFPTVNIEALACGTPVVTFDTGGSPESVDESSGIVVPKDDFDGLLGAVRRVCEEKPFDTADCVRRGASFDRGARFAEYTALYRELTEKSHE